MDIVSGIGAYAADQAKADTSLRMSVASVKGKNDQAKKDGEAAVKLIESAGKAGKSANASGVGGRLDVNA